MPFIHARFSEPVTQEKEVNLKEKLGEAISLIPGKSESWLMLEIEENCHLYFKGNGDLPSAFVEVKIFGSTTDAAFDAMTERLTQIITGELSIPSDRIYIQYEECSHWGWNGNNF